MRTDRQRGLDLFRQMMPELVPAGDGVQLRDGGFADELGEIGLENLFARLWGRDGLSLRDRSLITVAILVATRATDELRLHFQIALRNGVTRTELEELVYHSS
ncbi:MAG: 4-carboxymuconolactone decarboxylase, partial [Mycobacterium sp.]|nr:4-carboxymuconolactone decarboxylase [Mycobacterium sp.]